MRRLLYAYAFFLPFEQLFGQLPGVGHYLKPYRVIGFLLLALWLTKAMMRPARLRLDAFDVGYIAIFVTGLAMAGGWLLVGKPVSFGWALSDSGLILFGFGIYLVIKNQLVTPEDVGRLLWTFAVATAVSIFVDVVAAGGLSAHRVAGFYDNPNRLAAALGIAIVVMLSRLNARTDDDQPRNLIAIGIAVLLMGLVIVLTGSRGGLVALGAGLLALVAFGSPGRRGATRYRAAVGALIVVALGASFALFRPSTATVRLQLPVAYASGNRLDLAESSWHVALDHYLLGAGTAQYRFLHRDYVAKLNHLHYDKLANYNLGTHNDYMDILAESGLVALAIYLWMLWRLLVGLRKEATASSSIWPSMCLPVFIFIVVLSFSHGTLLDPEYWLVMAVLTAMVRPHTESADDAPDDLVSVAATR
jgi:O-antigen ligase